MNSFFKRMSSLVKNNFIYSRLYLWKNSIKERQVYSQLKEIENLNHQQLYEYQEKRLYLILKYAYKNCTYYKDLFNNNKIDISKKAILKSIPLLTKKIIKDNSSALLSKKYRKRNLREKSTGGSTGEPLVFYTNSFAGINDNAHHWYHYSLMGYTQDDIIFGAGGFEIPLELRNQNIFWLHNNKNSVWGEYVFSVLYITNTNIGFYIKKLTEIKPSILRGYPSFFDKLAQYILTYRIQIDFRIKGIILTSEICSINQRKKIEEAFSTMVYFEYGHAEVSVFCYTKDNSYIYQSSPIYGYIEVLNEDGMDTSIGEVGNIIVTGFSNHGMPFIRYVTGDLGEVVFRNGGIVHFKRIIGRSQDFVISKDNQKVSLTALIFGQHLVAFKNIIQWQIVQNKVGLIVFNIIKGSSYKMNDEDEIRNKIQSVTDIDVIFNYVEEILLTKRGKHLFLIQNL